MPLVSPEAVADAAAESQQILPPQKHISAGYLYLLHEASPPSSIPLHGHMRMAEEDNLRMLLERCTTEQEHETVLLNN